MIKITRDNETKVVTKGAYEEFYRKQGFKVVNDKPAFSKPVKDAKIVEENDKPSTNKGNRK